MRFRFTLIDRNNVQTVITEPVGWDALDIDLKRDLDKHGIFDDYQGNDFLFYGAAARLIKDEYDAYGIRGNMSLLIEYACAGQLAELYTSKLIFGKYNYECGVDGCHVKIPIEAVSDVMKITNQWEKKVDLQTLKAIDLTTDLVPYPKLGFDLDLPSKGIRLQNKATFLEERSLSMTLDEVPIIQYDSNPTAYNFGWFQAVPEIDVTKFSEFGEFATAATPQAEFICSGFYQDSKCPDLFKIREGNIAGTVARTLFMDWSSLTALLFNDQDKNNFAFINGGFNLTYSYELQFDIKNCRILYLNAFLVVRRKDGTFEILHNAQIVSATGGSGSPGGYVTGSYWAPDTIHTAADSFTISNVVLHEGDYLFMGLAGLTQYRNIDARDGLAAFNLTGKSGSITMEALSNSEVSPGKVFMIHEALSRITEFVTNDTMRAYSDYFGRVDSLPYAHDVDGAGGLEVITKGLFIRRQENRIPDKPFLMTESLKDMWDGLDPIHHIGYGIEPDPTRPGLNRLRVEHWKFFYNNDIVMVCQGVNKISTEIISSEHYSAFTFGYAKWEAEEFNGLDEFLTKRNYRTTLEELNNTLNRLSTMIASGYAIEITKRKGSIDSKDWRFDNDTFIICCKRDDDFEIQVELGNINDAENIIDPDTIYNWRIRPIYNAMRWIDKIFAGYKNPSPDDKIIFMDGDGNYHASGQMLSTAYKLENQVIEESETITRDLFANPSQAAPILATERKVFEFPMSAADYKAIKANPYGKIQWQGCETGEGWIETINYKTDLGLGSFRLIPAHSE